MGIHSMRSRPVLWQRPCPCWSVFGSLVFLCLLFCSFIHLCLFTKVIICLSCWLCAGQDENVFFYHKFLNELFTLQLKCASVQPLQAACANFEPAWWLLPSTVRPIMFRPSTGLQRSISRGQEPGLQVSLQGADGDDVRIGSVEQCCHEPCSFLDLENCYDWASHCT